jgi:hypothetical protein
MTFGAKKEHDLVLRKINLRNDAVIPIDRAEI